MFPTQGTVGLALQGSVELWFAVDPLSLELGVALQVENYVRYDTKSPVGEFGRNSREILFNTYTQFAGRQIEDVHFCIPTVLQPGDVLVAGRLKDGARAIGGIVDKARFAALKTLCPEGSLIALPDGNAIQELGILCL